MFDGSFLDSIADLRRLAEAARQERETCTDPDLRQYLLARACQADCEASARARYLRINPMSIPIPEQVACVEREIRMRRRVYGRQVANGDMNPAKATREIETMEAVLATLQAAMPPPAQSSLV